MNLPEFGFLLDIAQKVVTFGIAAWLYLEKKRDTTHAQIESLADDHDRRLDDHARRLATLEAQSITHDDLSELHDKINQVATASSRVEGVVTGISDTLRLILSRITERGMQ